MLLQQTIDSLLINIANKSMPSRGMIFSKNLYDTSLDYSVQSLNELDAFLEKIALRAQQDTLFSTESLLKRKGGSVFFVALAAYLGNYIVKKASKRAEIKSSWHGEGDILRMLRRDVVYAEQVTLMLGNVPFYPLLAILDKMADPQNPEKDLSIFVAKCLEIVNSCSPNDLQAYVAPSPSPSSAQIEALNSNAPIIQKARLENQRNQQNKQSKQPVNTVSTDINNGAIDYTQPKKELSPDILMQIHQQKNDMHANAPDFDAKIKRLIIVGIAIIIVGIAVTIFR